MCADRLPHVCYGMLKGLDAYNRVTWASNIKILLCKFGLEYVWNAQGVGLLSTEAIALNKKKTRKIFVKTLPELF